MLTTSSTTLLRCLKSVKELSMRPTFQALIAHVAVSNTTTTAKPPKTRLPILMSPMLKRAFGIACVVGFDTTLSVRF
jgi:hypothetical protein